MAPATENPRAESASPGRRWLRRGKFALPVIALGAIVAAALHYQQEAAVREATALVAGATQPPTSLASVARHLRESQLITSRIETLVRAQTNDDNWFGSVVATVEAPARLSYGVDLSKLESSGVNFSPIGSVYSLRVPAPKRIATEVFTGQEKTDVALAGLRFRSLSGEAQLGLARARLHEQALRMRLSEPETRKVRENAREEIAALVRRIVGESAAVRVSFEDEELWRTTVAAGQ